MAEPSIRVSPAGDLAEPSVKVAHAPGRATAPSPAPAARKINFLHLILVAMALPMILAAANHAILSRLGEPRIPTEWIAPLFAFYVAQVAIVGWAAGRFVQPWQLRWIVFGWIMLLIDLQLATLTNSISIHHEGLFCLATGVFTGQMSVIVVWAILGRRQLLSRLPAMMVVGWIYLGFYHSLVGVAQDSNRFDWDELFYLQLVILTVMCFGLRLRGFSLAIVDESAPVSANDGARLDGSRGRQFSIRDALIGTTLLAALLGAAKAGDLLQMKIAIELYASGLLFVLTIAVASAAISIVALWAALGQGKLLLRVAMALLLPPAVGSAVARYCLHLQQTFRPGARITWSYWTLHRWYDTGYWWIGWMFLIGALLAASLIIYRVLGYRLMRGDRSNPPTAAN